MLMRFLQTSVLAVSTALFGIACNRISEAGDAPVSSSSSVPVADPSQLTHQWDGLISGNPRLPVPVTTLLRKGANEEGLARNPRIPLEERVPATVSQARHQRLALKDYNEALNLLGSNEEFESVRVSIRRKTAYLQVFLNGLDGMNRRLGSQ